MLLLLIAMVVATMSLCLAAEHEEAGAQWVGI